MKCLASILFISFCLVPRAEADPAAFDHPVPVIIEGYDGHAMEPFISRDGAWLFFNNRNQPGDATDIHLATRISDTRFRYIGILDGARSGALDGVPSMDRDGDFYFVSPRAYERTWNTLWRGRFREGELADVEQLGGDAPRQRPLWVNIDAEVTADGTELYFVDSLWDLAAGNVATANIRVAETDGSGGFNRTPDAVSRFEAINTDNLEFAPAISEDGLTLYFTRADIAALRQGKPDGFGIFVATRETLDAPFDPPRRIETIRGYVEAPSITPDGCGIYFHKRIDGVFRLQLARRSNCSAP